MKDMLDTYDDFAHKHNQVFILGHVCRRVEMFHELLSGKDACIEIRLDTI